MAQYTITIDDEDDQALAGGVGVWLKLDRPATKDEIEKHVQEQLAVAILQHEAKASAEASKGRIAERYGLPSPAMSPDGPIRPGMRGSQ